MNIRFHNTNNKKYVCKIDDQYVKAKRDTYGNLCVQSDVKCGQHTIEIAQKTVYLSVLCYFNAFNPIYFIWLLKFLDVSDVADQGIFTTTISFETEENDGELNLFLNDDIITYTETKGLKKVKIISQGSDALQEARRKNTRVVSALFYMVLANVLSVIGCIASHNFFETILFCLAITAFSARIVFQSVKIYEENTGVGSLCGKKSK